MSKKHTHTNNRYDLTQITPIEADAILVHLARSACRLYKDDTISDEKIGEALQSITKKASNLAPIVTALWNVAYSNAPLSAADITTLENATEFQDRFARFPKKKTDNHSRDLSPVELEHAFHGSVLATLQPGREAWAAQKNGITRRSGLTFPDLAYVTPEQAQTILDTYCEQLSLPHRADDDKYADLTRYLSQEAEALIPTVKSLALMAHPHRTIDLSDYVVFAGTEKAINHHMQEDGCAEAAATALKKAIFKVMKPAVNLERLGIAQSV
jgi:hypothetical protein